MSADHFTTTNNTVHQFLAACDRAYERGEMQLTEQIEICTRGNPLADSKYETVETHINMIRPGDTVLHNGELRTVGKSDIKRGGFMVVTLFGDSYRLGNVLVQLARVRRTD
ncbi:hypothetical protein [Pseudomonas sp. PS02290]|uniref:hypothetical protein n=1 Tax=Pseudomonas sp. PS02290 TaxID=2991430 RepID=UPI001A11A1D9|nr:hypothetical protein [Pseudomonas sp. PS02290]MBF9247132.1 hypothetical protein [Pseudomonas syringae pv. tomato]MBW8025001.1 hypothetical protein [Pseudomonas syringae pv. tomato]